MQDIAFDAHKHDPQARVENTAGHLIREARLPHERGAMREFLTPCEPGSSVGVETVGNWDWMVDEIEADGCVPKLLHAYTAKLMRVMIHQTDKLDAQGLNRLQRDGTLPEVWILRGALREQRELPRTGMVLVQQRTRLKHRIHATWTKAALVLPHVRDRFGRRGRLWWHEQLQALPPQTADMMSSWLDAWEGLSQQIDHVAQRRHEAFHRAPEVDLLMTWPGVGFILSVVIAAEGSDVERFEGPDPLASYAGTTPCVHASGGKTRDGPLRPEVNR